MFDTLLKRLTGATPAAPLRSDDARLALAALMVRVARADHDYAPAEVAVIDELLAQRYQLPADEVAKLRAQAEDLETEAPDTVRFTRAIKDAVPYEDRRAVVESLWRVVLADDKRDHHEDGFLRLVANLLGVSDPDSARARQKAQNSD
ncbi:MAG: TerB family tellurite resistance protein [Paracoccaceae bacterium]